MWPGDGGAIYVPYVPFGGAAAKFTAYRVVNGFGQPTLAVAGQSQDRFGYGSSSAVVTSDGTTSGSGLVWIVWLPDSSGNGAELLAYDPNPSNGVLTLRGEWQIGQGNKFTTPTVNDSRIYVGARDGNVHAFAVLNQSAAQAPAPSRSRVANEDQRPDREG
jgi:iron transport multicopper oxidase